MNEHCERKLQTSGKKNVPFESKIFLPYFINMAENRKITKAKRKWILNFRKIDLYGLS